MTTPARARGATLAQTIDIETPELVTFSYTVAGVGSRVAAALIDYLLCLTLFISIMVAMAYMGAGRAAGRAAMTSDVWAIAIVVLGQLFSLWGYYVLWEGLADGQTPGKRVMRLRVVSDGGYSVTFAGSAIRNLVRILDMQPVFTYGIGIASIVATKQGKRLGDLAAGTLVVREELIHTRAPAARAPDADTSPSTITKATPARLTDDEFAVLERFMGRRTTLQPARRVELAARLVARFAHAFAGHAGTAEGPDDRLF